METAELVIKKQHDQYIFKATLLGFVVLFTQRQTCPWGGGHKDTTMNSFGCGEAPAENVNVQGPEFCADFSCK